MRQLVLALMVALPLGLAATAGTSTTSGGRDRPSPTTIAVGSGQVIGVAQDTGSIGWLEAAASGCRLHIRPSGGGSDRVVRYASGCLPAEHDLALADGRAAWGGYEEVRCSDTHAAVYAAVGSRARLVEEIPGDCLGYAESYAGLASDGRSFFYSVLVTSPKPSSSGVRNRRCLPSLPESPSSSICCNSSRGPAAWGNRTGRSRELDWRSAEGFDQPPMLSISHLLECALISQENVLVGVYPRWVASSDLCPTRRRQARR